MRFMHESVLIYVLVISKRTIMAYAFEIIFFN